MSLAPLTVTLAQIQQASVPLATTDIMNLTVNAGNAHHSVRHATIQAYALSAKLDGSFLTKTKAANVPVVMGLDKRRNWSAITPISVIEKKKIEQFLNT